MTTFIESNGIGHPNANSNTLKLVYQWLGLFKNKNKKNIFFFNKQVDSGRGVMEFELQTLGTTKIMEIKLQTLGTTKNTFITRQLLDP